MQYSYRFLFTLLLFTLLLHPAMAEDWIYRLHKGENLTLVAERFLKPQFTPEQLQVYNGVLKDRQMPVGTEIRVPMDWLKQSLAGVEVRYVVGEAELYRRGSDEPDSIARGDSLAVGDRVITAIRSAISFEFADSTRLLLGPDSEVVFDALSTYKGQGMLDTRIRLQRGRLENRVKPISNPDARYEIHTPAAVTVVRGTEFRIVAEADGLSRSEVTEGLVNVNAAGESVPVNAGEGTRILPGQPPEAPRALLSAPDLSALETSLKAEPGRLSWSPLQNALAYRVQLMNPQQTPLISRRVEQAWIELPRLDPGPYELRVRGIDDWELEGFSARHDFQVLDEPEPEPVEPPPPVADTQAPQLLPPRFSPGWIDVRWEPLDDAWSHRLMLARDPAFNHLLLDQLTRSNHYLLPQPPPGRYYLAVEAQVEASGGPRSQVYLINLPGYR
jgi:hypothetical protein